MKNNFFLFFLIFNLCGQNLLASPRQARIRANQIDQSYTYDDVKVEIEFGKNMAASFLARFHLTENSNAQKYLNSLGAYVVSKVGRPELHYYFALIDSDEINAYALPGGFIFVTKAALLSASSELALLGILAHEVAHVNYRHVVNALGLRSESFLMGAMGAISGSGTQSFTQMIQGLVKLADELFFTKGLKKEQEMESDRFASEFLTASGISTNPYKNLLNKLDKSSAHLDIILKTHPSFSDRVQALDAMKEYATSTKEIDSVSEKRYQAIINTL